MPRAQPAVVVENQCNRDGGVGVAIYVESAGAADTTNTVQVAVVHSTVSDPTTQDAIEPLAQRIAAHLLRQPDARAPLKHVQMVAVEAKIRECLSAESRGVLLHGLPGAGKTTLLRNLAKQFGGFFLRLDYLGEHEPWSARGDTAVAQNSENFRGDFQRFVRVLAQQRDEVILCLDGLDRARDVRSTCQRLLDDSAGFPANVRLVIAVRRSALPEDVLLDLQRTLPAQVVSVPVLQDDDLGRFLRAFGLPQDLPNPIRRTLTTPFMVDAFAKAIGDPGALSTALGAIAKIFETAVAANSAKQVFLRAYSTALAASDSYAPISVDLLLDTAPGQGRLSSSDCDVENPASSAAHFFRQGLMTDEGSGLRMVHDRLTEYLVATELLRDVRGRGFGAVSGRLLGARPDGPLCAALDLFLELLVKGEERAEFVAAVLAPARSYFQGMTPEDRKNALGVATYRMYDALSSGDWGGTARDTDSADEHESAARRAGRLVASMFVASPSAIAPVVRDLDSHLSWLVWSAAFPAIVADPFFFALIDPFDGNTVQTIVSAFHGLAHRSLGVRVFKVDASEEQRAASKQRRVKEAESEGTFFPGPQLPISVDTGRPSWDLDVILPDVADAVVRVLPSILNLVSVHGDNIACVDWLLDYYARLGRRRHAVDPWGALLRDLKPRALMALALPLSSAYPYVELWQLLKASGNAFSAGESWDRVSTFNVLVVARALDFVKLQLTDEADVSHQLWATHRGCLTIRMGAELGGLFLPVRKLTESLLKLKSAVVRVATLELTEQFMAAAAADWQARTEIENDVSQRMVEFFMNEGRGVVELLHSQVAVWGIDLPDDASVLSVIPTEKLDDEERDDLARIRGRRTPRG